MTTRTRWMFLTCLSLLAADTRPGQADNPYVFDHFKPYLSADDSPYDRQKLGFCIEDFEDGSFDVPGAFGNGTVVGPGGDTDSVDGDDGVIDGSGTNGHSYFRADGLAGISITFNPERTNGLPHEVGIVWTDGGAISQPGFEVFDSQGNLVLSGLGGNHADEFNNGGTSEDRLYGITGPGISKIRITSDLGGIEIDHVQLDRCILCGDVGGDFRVTATDALSTLKTAVGQQDCLLCLCDVNGSGDITAADALSVLKRSVGQPQVAACPACPFGAP